MAMVIVDFKYCGYCDPIHEDLYLKMEEAEKDNEMRCASLRINKTLKNLGLDNGIIKISNC